MQILAPAVLPASERSRRVHFEAVDSGFIAAHALLGVQGGIDLEQDRVEGGSEVGTVDGGVSGGFRVVDVLALGTVELDGAHVRKIGLTHGQKRVSLADNAGALSKVAFLVLVKLFKQC